MWSCRGARLVVFVRGFEMQMKRWTLGVCVIGWLVPTSAWAAEYEISPGDDVGAAIAMLQPGDELVLRGGMYTVQSRLSVSLMGTADSPIVIRAADGEVPHIHRPNASQNLIDLDVAHYVEFRGIEFSGGSAGIRMSDVRSLTIRECDVHDTGDVAIRANDSGRVYEDLHIVGNNIHDTNNTGEGMYLGCNDDACRVQNSIVELNWVHHTNGPTIEQGDGIELKEGSSGNVIRHNVIHDTNFPCILVYSTVGNGEANVLEGNVMWNCGDHGIQAAADATIRNNIILAVGNNGIAMQPHQSGAPANLSVVHNTVVVPSGSAMSVSGAVGPVTLANNALYAMSGSAIAINGDDALITSAGNVGVGGFAGAGYVEGSLEADFDGGTWAGMPPIDVFPASDGALVGAGDAAYVTAEDFNTRPQNGPPDVGAYAFSEGGNPGWTIVAGFKEFPPDEPDTGTDTDSDSDSDTDSGPDTDSSPDGDATDGSDSSDSDGADGTDACAAGTCGDPTNAASGGMATGSDTDGTAGSQGEGSGCACGVHGAGGAGGSMLVLLLAACMRRRREKASRTCAVPLPPADGAIPS